MKPKVLSIPFLVILLIVLSCNKEEIQPKSDDQSTYLYGASSRLKNEIITSRLVAYNFDSNIQDISLNQHNGFAEGTPTYQTSSSGRGKAAAFNDSWRIVIDQSTSQNFTLTTDWTMAFSINPQNDVDWGNGFIQRLDEFGYCGRRGLYLLEGIDLDRLTPQCAFFGSTYEYGTFDSDIATISGIKYGSWNRLVIVHRSDQTGDIYLNGVKIHANISMRIDELGIKQMSLGGNYRNDGCYGDDFATNILLDDFALFSIALTEPEVKKDKLNNPLGF